MITVSEVHTVFRTETVPKWRTNLLMAVCFLHLYTGFPWVLRLIQMFQAIWYLQCTTRCDALCFVEISSLVVLVSDCPVIVKDIGCSNYAIRCDWWFHRVWTCFLCFIFAGEIRTIHVYYIFSTLVSSWMMYSVLATASFPDIHDWTFTLRSRLWSFTVFFCVWKCVNHCVVTTDGRLLFSQLIHVVVNIVFVLISLSQSIHYCVSFAFVGLLDVKGFVRFSILLVISTCLYLTETSACFCAFIEICWWKNIYVVMPKLTVFDWTKYMYCFVCHVDLVQ